MGKGTQHRDDWKFTTLEVVLDAVKLYVHSVKIMSNPKVFNPKNDFKAIFSTKEEAEEAQRKIAEFVAKIGMELHPDKTLVARAKDGIELLGFIFRVTDTGRVLMMRHPKRVKEIRRRMRRLTNKIRRGDCRREALAESYQCVRACMAKGNSARLLRNMDEYYNNLEKEIEYGSERSEAA